MAKQKHSYSVFISYRREGGSESAKYLHDSLTARGYNVFLDVESLRSGPFNTELYKVIDSADDFLLILPPNGLDRCVDESDWVRLEIERARQADRNIIPIMLKGFSFPEQLPESIAFLRLQNGLGATEAAYYDAFVDHLESFLVSRPRSKRKRPLIAACAVLALLIGMIAYYCATTYPLTRTQGNVVSSLISYMTLNLSEMDMAGSDYLKALDRAAQYIEGKTTDSESTLLYELTRYRNDIDGHVSNLTGLPEALRQDLLGSRFDVGNLEAMKTALDSLGSEYSRHLSHIKDNILTNDALRPEHRIDYINMLKAWAQLDAEMLFYQLNESLLPITNQGALKYLKNDVLPSFSFIYSGRLDLTRDKEALTGKEEAIFLQYERLLDDYRESIEREASYVDPDFIREELALLQLLGEDRDLDVTGLTERLEGILEKSERLEALKAEYVESSDQLKAQKEALYEKFKPESGDEAWLLWGKGIKFLTAYMPDVASECFEMCEKTGDETYALPSSVAARFAKVCKELDLKGGVVVCYYEPDLPRQAVEIGDVLYAIDGTLIHNVAEYEAAVTDGLHTVSLLRFSEDGYDAMESTIDTVLGRIAILGLNPEPTT